MIILSIATATFLTPMSQAFGLRITCALGNLDSANGLHTECEPKDDGCSVGGIYYRQLTEEECRARGGVPLDELYM